jgi:uncharacterized membrane protein
MVTLPNITLGLAVLATALMAGLFYSYSCSVNPGLGRLPDAEYLSAMQSINRAILNPVFFSAFIGALLLLPLSAWLNYTPQASMRFWLLVAATILYSLGLFGVTVAFNVSLNEMLDKCDIGVASATDLADMRARFEGPWNTWHAVRTAAVILSLILSLMACIMSAKMK